MVQLPAPPDGPEADSNKDVITLTGIPATPAAGCAESPRQIRALQALH